MHKKDYTALFAVVMLLVLLPFVPSALSTQRAEADTVPEASPFSAKFEHGAEVSASEQLQEGYVGDYGLSILPHRITEEQPPQIRGVETTKLSPPPNSTFSSATVSPPAYQAQLVEKSHGYLNLNPDQSITVWVDFLNTGTETWHSTGANYVALNAGGPAGRESVFMHDFWHEYYYRPTRLLQDEVKPGETGRFRFALQAPETVATYLEEFQLVAENLLWIPGGYINFTIGVGQSAKGVPLYRAEEVERSIGGIIEIDPDSEFTFWADFKNTGTTTWYNSGGHFIALNVIDPVGRVSTFKHDYWNEYYYRPARLEQKIIHPGETGRFRFALKAPHVEDYYTESFRLVAENFQWIPGGTLTLDFKVGDPPIIRPVYTVSDEPIIRVGLFSSTDPVKLTVNTAYTITDMQSDTTLNKNKDVTSTIQLTNDTYIRVSPSAGNGITTINNSDNAPLWNSSLNDNEFRGTIEIRYSEETGKTWVINELPLESYLRGLAEVSNGQPEEYLKALITAARSYALWHMLNGGKHPDEFYDINATTDQVYRGYGFEQRSEDPVEAVVATAGTVITHPDAVTQLNTDGIAIAAYSSGTDGRTRSWTEVWAGSGFPWLVTVDDPYGALPNWDTLEGNHMVGMSALGARGYALEEGKTYDWILQHYYTGTQVEKLY